MPTDTHTSICLFLFGGRYRLILEIFALWSRIFIERNRYYDGNYKEDREKLDAKRTSMEKDQDLGASGGTKTRTNRIYRESTVDSYERSNHESIQLTDDKMPVLLRGRRRAEGWLMATSETRMGSTCPTNEKGIKRKVVVRSWIANEREIESMFTSMEFRRCAMRGTIDGRRGNCSCECESGQSDRSWSGRKSWI